MIRAILSHGTVLVSGKAVEVLSLQGYGAKKLLTCEEVATPSGLVVPCIATDGAAQDHSAVGENPSTNSVESGYIPKDMLLHDEEALYLLMKGIIAIFLEEAEVEAPSEIALTSDELWGHWQRKNKHFGVKYRVYRELKELGYIVKPGMHYGVDYSVYRSIPAVCHSEFCVLVVDSCQGHSNSSHSHTQIIPQSWRQITTLTRVMPDVMKLLILFYVYPKAIDEEMSKLESQRDGIGASSISPDSFSSSTTTTELASIRERELQLIFGSSELASIDSDDSTGAKCDSTCSGSSNMAETAQVHLSRPTSVDALAAHPIVCLVRRSPAKTELYQFVEDLQKKYRDVSVLKRYRQLKNEKKKHKKRFDPSQIRYKVSSRNQFLWEELNRNDGSINSNEEDEEESHDEQVGKELDTDNGGLKAAVEASGDVEQLQQHEPPLASGGLRENDIWQERERLRQKRYRQLRRIRERNKFVEERNKQLQSSTTRENQQESASDSCGTFVAESLVAGSVSVSKDQITGALNALDPVQVVGAISGIPDDIQSNKRRKIPKQPDSDESKDRSVDAAANLATVNRRTIDQQGGGAIKKPKKMSVEEIRARAIAAVQTALEASSSSQT